MGYEVIPTPYYHGTKNQFSSEEFTIHSEKSTYIETIAYHFADKETVAKDYASVTDNNNRDNLGQILTAFIKKDTNIIQEEAEKIGFGNQLSYFLSEEDKNGVLLADNAETGSVFAQELVFFNKDNLIIKTEQEWNREYLKYIEYKLNKDIDNFIPVEKENIIYKKSKKEVKYDKLTY